DPHPRPPATPPYSSQELARAQADLVRRRANRQWTERQLQRAESRVAQLHAGPRRRDRSLLDQAEQTAGQAAAELRQAKTLEQEAIDAVQRHSQAAEARQQAMDNTAAERHDLADAARQLRAALSHAR